MTFLRGIKALKVKEVPPYASEYAKANLAPGTLWQRATTHVHSYKAHLDAGSVKPLFDTMALLCVGAYALAWPQVRGGGTGPGVGRRARRERGRRRRRRRPGGCEMGAPGGPGPRPRPCPAWRGLATARQWRGRPGLA